MAREDFESQEKTRLCPGCRVGLARLRGTVNGKEYYVCDCGYGKKEYSLAKRMEKRNKKTK